MSDKSRGILTPTDREFLQSEEPYYDGKNARQSRYDRRRGIRHRIVTSILDFREIATRLDDEQRRQIFTSPEENGAESPEEFNFALQRMLRWIYLGCREAELDFDTFLRNAVTRAEEDYNRFQSNEIVDVNVDFNVEITNRYSGVDELARKLENGDLIPARVIYQIPTVLDVPVDPEEVDTVRVGLTDIPNPGESQIKIMETILREHLGIDADVEIDGMADMDLNDVSEE
jgi:hypothetical protein